MAFIGELSSTNDPGGNDYQGIFSSSGGTATEIARTNSAPPEGNGTFVFLNDPVLNDAGQIGFYADLGGTSGGGSDNSGLYRSNGAITTKMVREGDIAPGVQGGTFSGFGFPSMNEVGVLAFNAGISGAASGSNQGVFTSDGTTVSVVTRRGEAAPDGNGMMATFDDPIINDAGQVGYIGFVSGSAGGSNDNSGVFLSNGALMQVAREGSPAGANGLFASFDNLSLNDASQMVFNASLRSTAGGTLDDGGIYFFDLSLGLIEVLREGDSFLGSTVTSLGLLGFDFPSIQMEENSGLSDIGRIGFQFRLADNREGVAVWAVPEPSGVGLLALGLIPLLRRRRATLS